MKNKEYITKDVEILFNKVVPKDMLDEFRNSNMFKDKFQIYFRLRPQGGEDEK